LKILSFICQSDDNRSLSPPPTTKAPTKIIREYSETSSASDIHPTGTNSTKNNHNQAQSDEDDFW
jgi:hypothetical protein